MEKIEQLIEKLKSKSAVYDYELRQLRTIIQIQHNALKSGKDGRYCWSGDNWKEDIVCPCDIIEKTNELAKILLEIL